MCNQGTVLLFLNLLLDVFFGCVSGSSGECSDDFEVCILCPLVLIVVVIFRGSASKYEKHGTLIRLNKGSKSCYASSGSNHNKRHLWISWQGKRSSFDPDRNWIVYCLDLLFHPIWADSCLLSISFSLVFGDCHRNVGLTLIPCLVRAYAEFSGLLSPAQLDQVCNW